MSIEFLCVYGFPKSLTLKDLKRRRFCVIAESVYYCREKHCVFFCFALEDLFTSSGNSIQPFAKIMAVAAFSDHIRNFEISHISRRIHISNTYRYRNTPSWLVSAE